jgi:outer membrane protein
MRRFIERALCGAILSMFAVSALAQQPRTLSLSLEAAVSTAIENNRELRAAKLRRASAGYDLYVAHGRFLPQLSLLPFANRFTLNSDVPGATTETRRSNSGLTSDLALLTPTGARVAGEWNGAGTSDRISGDGTRYATQGTDLLVDQPLLRGGGFRVNTAPVRIAEMTDRIESENERAVAIGVVTATVFAYRNLLRSREQVAIVKTSLDRSRDLLGISRSLIEAGRMAPADLVQAEADVAVKELSVLLAENDLESARVDLLKVLDIDTSVSVVPTDELRMAEVRLDGEELIRIAQQKRPDYLQAVLGGEIADQQLIVARNNRLFDIDLTLRYGENANFAGSSRLPVTAFDTRDRSLQTGISLGYTFGDRTRVQRSAQATLATEIAKTVLREATDNVRLEVLDAIRTVGMRQRQVALARAARELTEKKLDIEKEKLRAGRSSSFQVTIFESDLVQAKSSELSANIAYLNALTTLDATVGRTLDVWKITLAPN